MFQRALNGIVPLLALIVAATCLSGSARAQAQQVQRTQAAFSWKIFGPPPAGIAWDQRAIPLTIVVGPVPATNVVLARPRLGERDSLVPLDLELCENREQACRPPRTLAANQAHPLFLRLPPDRGAGPGNYSGTLVIAASEKQDGESLEVSLFVTNSGLLLLGAITIAIGVVLSWLVTVAVRNLVSRKELERMLALLEVRIERLKGRLDTAFPSHGAIKLPTIDQKLAEAVGSLSEARSRLPSALPTPWQGQWPHRAEFEAEVTRLDALLDRLEAIATLGLLPAGRLLAANPGDPKIIEAIASIDAKAAAGTQPLADLIAEVQTILRAAQPVPTRLARATVVEAPGPVEKLDFEIALLGAASWGVILATTVLVGALVLLLPNKGFGQWDDFVVCLLWGFGLPVAGGQLTSLSADSVRTAFSVTRPG